LALIPGTRLGVYSGGAMRGPAAVVLCIWSVPFVAGASQEAGTRARSAYERAIELAADGHDTKALSLLWEAAGLAPRDPDIQNRLGEALEEMGALDAAVEAYSAAASARPSFDRAVNNLILALVKVGRSHEALERARTRVSAAPRDADRWFTLGLAQSELDVEEAIGSFRRTLELAPAHALARYNLALVLKRADRLLDALDELHRVIEIAPRAEAHYTLGLIYWHRGDAGRAVAALRAALVMDPRHAEAHHVLGTVLDASGDRENAAAALRRALILRPDLTGAHYTLARVLQGAGDETGARRHLAEAERLRERARVEQEARTWTSVGTEKLDAGDPTAALECFRRATGIFEAYAAAHYQTGRALQRLGQAEAARAAFARARQLNPSLVPPERER
jgi:tetratricopeptide (TPR) repeat protein